MIYTETRVALVELVCWVCYMPFAMPKTMHDKCAEKGDGFYCPKGCHLGLGKSKLQELQDQLTREKQAREQEQAAHRRSVEWRDKDIIAKKGQITKLKNRAANGICPCCTRSFQNLQRHMTTKHPDFTKEAGA